MSDEYTPDTDKVRHVYASSKLPTSPDYVVARRKFDRWLTAHDRQVRADALRGAAVPLLLADLRELHEPFTVDGVTYCKHCVDPRPDDQRPWPCPTVRELDRIEAEYTGDGEA